MVCEIFTYIAAEHTADGPLLLAIEKHQKQEEGKIRFQGIIKLNSLEQYPKISNDANFTKFVKVFRTL
jgi:hypothetical protein